MGKKFMKGFKRANNTDILFFKPTQVYYSSVVHLLLKVLSFLCLKQSHFYLNTFMIDFFSFK